MVFPVCLGCCCAQSLEDSERRIAATFCTTVCVSAYWFLHLGWKEDPACWPPVAWSWCFWRWGAAWPPQPPVLGIPVAPWGPWSGAEEQRREEGQVKLPWCTILQLVPSMCVHSFWIKIRENGHIPSFTTFYLLRHLCKCGTGHRFLSQAFLPSSRSVVPNPQAADW